MMTLLQIIQEVAPRVGVQKPNSAIGSTDKGVLQLIALLNEEGQELASRTQWQNLQREGSFSTVASADQGKIDGTIVASGLGFDYILNDTIFNRTTKLPIFGPLAPRTWQARKAMVVTGPVSNYRIRGGRLLIDPIPTAGHNCYFEYMTKYWVENAAGDTWTASMTADTNVPLLEDMMLLKGLTWRWKKTKGLEYAEDFNAYELYVADKMAKDGARKTLSLEGSRNATFDPVVVVPSGNFTL